MRVSIITSILDSHEIVRRQLRHYEQMPLPADVELVLIDDGSDPPLEFQTTLPQLVVYQTHNKTPWSEHIARNIGARMAQGEYLLFVDIDYIVTAEAVAAARRFRGDRMDICRRFGVLDEQGNISTDPAELREWGLRDKYCHGDPIPGHRSQYLMRRGLFLELGGYREDLAGENHPHGGGPGNRFHGMWRLWQKRGRVTVSLDKLDVLMFPSGKYCERNNNNPKGLFHTLARV